MTMNVAGVGGGGMPNAVSGASARMPPQQKMTNLYNSIDASGAGAISQSQFNQAFQNLNPSASFKAAGASSVWNALDPTGSGQVSQSDFVNGMKNMMYQLRQNSPTAAQTAATATQGLYNITA